LHNTINKIADHIAAIRGEHFNEVFKDQVRFTVNYYRAEFLKQSLQRNYVDRQFYQTLIIPLILVDKGDTCYISLDCPVRRTERILPETIRTGGTRFKFFGSVGREIDFTYTDFEVVKKTKHNRVTKDIIRWYERNNFGYVVGGGSTKIKFVEAESLLVNPYDANTCVDDCMNDDKPYPIPADLLRTIVNGILSSEFQLMKPDEIEAKLENKEE